MAAIAATALRAGGATSHPNRRRLLEIEGPPLRPGARTDAWLPMALAAAAGMLIALAATFAGVLVIDSAFHMQGSWPRQALAVGAGIAIVALGISCFSIPLEAIVDANDARRMRFAEQHARARGHWRPRASIVAVSHAYLSRTWQTKAARRHLWR